MRQLLFLALIIALGYLISRLLFPKQRGDQRRPPKKWYATPFATCICRVPRQPAASSVGRSIFSAARHALINSLPFDPDT
jgi:hypothetical protein